MKFSKSVNLLAFVLIVVLHGLFFYTNPKSSQVVVAKQSEQVQKLDLSTVTIEPEPEPEPEPELEPKPEPEAKPEPKPKPKPKRVHKPVKKPLAKSKPKPKLSASKARIVKASYIALVKAAIEANKYYPKRAKRLKHEGVVTLRFTILADGSISNIKVIGASNYTRLNAGAIETLKRVGKFKPIPEKLGMKRWEIDLPINYTLR
ncbi:energy transducer TonB [Sulfurovum mangrovi]|uniref:energy transducer TonB n=1 Tax=Sulfurovum mangrovi TaxID=2893889 RepID=UPI001E287B22|nr:energy transducer TonB [Sulfurovum mangrovi]UFH58298.1 TonB family protein [Sulfurovum mangrovi]